MSNLFFQVMISLLYKVMTAFI